MNVNNSTLALYRASHEKPWGCHYLANTLGRAALARYGYPSGVPVQENGANWYRAVLALPVQAH